MQSIAPRFSVFKDMWLWLASKIWPPNNQASFLSWHFFQRGILSIFSACLTQCEASCLAIWIPEGGAAHVGDSSHGACCSQPTSKRPKTRGPGSWLSTPRQASVHHECQEATQEPRWTCCRVLDFRMESSPWEWMAELSGSCPDQVQREGWTSWHPVQRNPTYYYWYVPASQASLQRHNEKAAATVCFLLIIWTGEM